MRQVDSPPQLSDDGSEQSCGNSDSGKENEEDGWRGPSRPRADSSKSSRPRSDSNKMPLQTQSLQTHLQQQSQPVAAGRVTRSASGICIALLRFRFELGSNQQSHLMPYPNNYTRTFQNQEVPP